MTGEIDYNRINDLLSEVVSSLRGIVRISFKREKLEVGIRDQVQSLNQYLLNLEHWTVSEETTPEGWGKLRNFIANAMVDGESVKRKPESAGYVALFATLSGACEALLLLMPEGKAPRLY